MRCQDCKWGSPYVYDPDSTDPDERAEIWDSAICTHADSAVTTQHVKRRHHLGLEHETTSSTKDRTCAEMRDIGPCGREAVLFEANT